MFEKKILIIDDSNFFAQCITNILVAADYRVIRATKGEDGLRMVREQKPDLVLLDVVMPDISGFEVCRVLREEESNNLMPIIMLTSQDNQEDKLIGLELGADDYITKPFNNREVVSRVRNTLRRIDRNRGANPLTGLQGNLEIQAEINSRIERKVPFAAIYADLDNFKAYNDVYGFAKGDIAIKMTADIFTDQVRDYGNSDDFIGHIGGDDFILVTKPKNSEEICKGIIAQFDQRVSELYSEEDIHKGYISTFNRLGQSMEYPIMSISLAIITDEFRSFQTYLQIAEIAAELKKKAKALPSSNFVKDWRKR
jgi:diguanylate cyclase (GGDEF)-like protein